MTRLGILFLALAACTHGPRVPATEAGKAYAFHIGALEAFALKDGEIDIANDGKTLGLGHDPSEVADELANAGLPRDRMSISIQPLLVKDGPRILLFDAGAADASWARAGLLPGSLASAGVKPVDVTDVFISHAHLDHVGGLITRAGELAFPNATVHLSTLEWAFMQKQADVANVTRAIASKVVPFEPGAKLLPEVIARATPGHTPGHSSYEIASRSDRLLYLGDVAHHVIVSVEHPLWPIEFDTDRDAAATMRTETLDDLSRNSERAYAVHFPFPGIGHIRANSHADSYVWVPQ